MARGGKITYKRKTRKKVRLEKKGSDESDEDYMVSDNGDFDESEDEYCSSLAGDESEESIGESMDEEEVGGSRGRKGSQGRKNNRSIKPRKKIVSFSEEDGVDYDGDDFAGAKRKRKEEDGIGDEKTRKKARFSSTDKNVDCRNEMSRKKAKVSYREDKEDGDYDDSDDTNDEEFTPDEIDGSDDDDEFTPDEVDGLDDDEEIPVSTKNNVSRLRVQKTGGASGRKRKRNAKALKRTRRKKPIKKKASRRKTRPNMQKNKKSNERSRVRRNKSIVNSDSDFVSSGPSDYDYTVSEEEREQIKEASEFCTRLTTSLRSSSSLKLIEEEEIVPPRRKPQGRKGKEKVVETKIEIAKQVCGICLSEEGKRTIRGILNCCSHYFCFACIMEWSKVESRCPLCKQRFATISRTGREDGVHDLREAVIQVPERDQVYQPSEEELMGYLNPYDNFFCIECHLGGDDAFMLLCDLCDTPAHTYCVGLGREVPEGNWYCDGCRPTALASSNAQALINPTPDFTVGPSPIVRETFDLNELYVPETPLAQVTGHSPSPRQPIGDFQAASGSGGLTLQDRRRISREIHEILNQNGDLQASLGSGSGALNMDERRQISRRIHQILDSRSRQSDRSNGVGPVSGISLFGSRIDPQHSANIHSEGRLPNNNTTTRSFYGREVLSPRSSSLRGQIAHQQASSSMDHSFGSEFSGINQRIGQSLAHSRSNNTGAAAAGSSISVSQFREVSLSSLQKEQVQSMVKSHLQSLSRNVDLGYDTFKNIARTSTHTILAACGLEHRLSEVYPIQTLPLTCDHLEISSANTQTCPIKGQCSSCFDLFVRNVVREITSTRVPLVSMV